MAKVTCPKCKTVIKLVMPEIKHEKTIDTFIRSTKLYLKYVKRGDVHISKPPNKTGSDE